MLNFALKQIDVTQNDQDIDFNGWWKNDLDSTMNISVDDHGHVTGTYYTAKGDPGCPDGCELIGFAANDVLSFTVNFLNSVASWVGQHTVEKGVPVVKTLWLLSKNIPDAEEPKKLWGTILTGYNNFTKTNNPNK